MFPFAFTISLNDIAECSKAVCLFFFFFFFSNCRVSYTTGVFFAKVRHRLQQTRRGLTSICKLITE